MSVRYLPKADTGAAVSDPGTFSFDPNDPNNTANQLDLLKILATLQNNEVQNQQGRQGTPVMPPIEQILNAQAARAKMQAESYAPGTEYLNGAQPGGLADALASFMGTVGGKVPKLDEGNRRVNPVPLDNLGSSFEDAMNLANEVASNVKMVGATANQPGAYGTMISDILGKLTAAKANEQTNGPTEFTGFERPIDTTFGVGPAMQNVQDIAAPIAKQKAEQQANQNMIEKALSSTGSGIPLDLGQYGSKVIDLLGQGLNKGQRALKPNIPGGGSTSGSGGSRGGGLPSPAEVFRYLTANHQGFKTVKKQANGGAVMGQHFAGPTLLQVGERSPKDKNYETSEVVLAAPGTVVAPIPKGMKNPSPEDAAGLLMAQIFKTLGSNQTNEGEQADINKSMTGSATGSSAGPMTVRDYYSGGSSGGGYATQPNDFNAYLQQLNQGLGTMANYNLGNRRLGLDTSLGYGNLALGNRQADNQRYATDVNAGVSERNSIRNQQAQQSDLWLRQLLGMRGLDLEQQKNQQDFTLGQGNLAARNAEATMTNQTNQRQLDLTSAQQAFERIMAGLSGAALPLLSRRAPTTGSM